MSVSGKQTQAGVLLMGLRILFLGSPWREIDLPGLPKVFALFRLMFSFSLEKLAERLSFVLKEKAVLTSEARAAGRRGLCVWAVWWCFSSSWAVPTWILSAWMGLVHQRPGKVVSFLEFRGPVELVCRYPSPFP